MIKKLIGAIAFGLLTPTVAIAAPEINYQCGYTVAVSFSDRDASVEYKGVLDVDDFNKRQQCRPVSFTITDRGSTIGSIRNFGDGLIQWQWRDQQGEATSYASALAALPSECLIYLDPEHSRVTKTWGF